MNRTITIIAGLLLTLVTLGCHKKDAAAGAGSNSPKRLLWVQPLKGHPTHQMTQMGFIEGARALGYEPVVVGTDSMDYPGTIALAEQELAAGNVAGMAIWTGNPSYNSLIERAAAAGIPVILPHFPIKPEEVPGAKGVISCDPAESAIVCAQRIGAAIHGKGSVAITQGSFNTTENLAASAFTKEMKEKYPAVKVLEPNEEGFDTPSAIAKAVSIMRGNDDLAAAFSTTGGGPVTWAGAERETGRKIIAVGMNYTRLNLDLVKSGEVYAVIGQPLWEESYGSAELLDKLIKGKTIEWWTKLPAPFITKDDLQPHYDRLDKIEAGLRK